MVGYLGNKTDVQMYVVLCVYAQSSAVISISGGYISVHQLLKKSLCHFTRKIYVFEGGGRAPNRVHG